MSVKPFDHDPITGTRITYAFDELAGTVALHYEQDCDGILDLNHHKRTMGREYYAADNDIWKVASIPEVVQLKWLQDHGVNVWNPDHIDGVMKLLDDPEWAYLKTAEVNLV